MECEKNANASGKVSEECTKLVDEKDWDEVDKHTEQENKSDEKDSNGNSDSSSDTN